MLFCFNFIRSIMQTDFYDANKETMRSDEDMRWTTLSSEYLFRRPWLTARRDRVLLPNGKINNEYYVLEYPTWINVIAITTDDKIILERQYRYAIGRVSCEIPAGVAEVGETPLAAAQRELREETGYVGGEWEELMVVSPNPGSMNNYSHTFIARNVVPSGETSFDETEDLEVFLCSQEEVYEKLLNGEFIQVMMVAPLWRYFATKVQK